MLRCPPPDVVEITPTGSLRATVRPPGSKCITNRALVCAALAEGDSLLVGALNNEDTRGLVDGLRRLGISIDIGNGGTRLAVRGCGGRIPVSQADLNVLDCGATMEFLAAAVSLGLGSYRFQGTGPEHHRGLRDLLAAFGQLGVEARCENGQGPPRLWVEGRGLQGGTADLLPGVSSDLLSGLLLVAPLAQRNIQVRVAAGQAFRQQILMTLAVMRAFQVNVPAGGDLRQIKVGAPQVYRGRRYQIEPDASAASYFWAAAAITRGMITVEGLSLDSLQSNVSFCSCLERMGCRVDYGPNSITVAGHRLKGIDVDIGALGDSWEALAAVALFAEGPTTIRGLGNGQLSQSDRIGNLSSEIQKLSASVKKSDQGLRIIPETVRGAEIDTHEDYRLAMSLALIGLKVPGVAIRDPGCAERNYPRFFEELMALGD